MLLLSEMFCFWLATMQKKSSWHYGRRTDEDLFNAHEKSLLIVVFSVLFSFSLHRKMLYPVIIFILDDESA